MPTANEEQVINDYLSRQREESDRTYGLQKGQLDQQWKIAQLNAKTQQQRNSIDDWYNKAQISLAKDRLAEDVRQFDLGHSLNQAKLGYDLVGTLASLEGPSNYFKAADYARGVSAQPQTATFLNALQTNTKMPGFGAQGGLPEAQSYGSLLTKLGAGGPSTGAGGAASGGVDTGAATGWTPNGNNLAAIGNIAAKGAGKLTGGALEGLTGTEQSLFTAGLGEIGLDVPTFLDQYRRSRVGQGFGSTAAA